LIKEKSTSDFLKLLIGIIILPGFFVNAQDKSNLEIFNQLVDSSVTRVIFAIPDSNKSLNLDLNSGAYEIFNPEVISDLSKNGYTLISDNKFPKLQYIVSNASVNYGDIFRDGFLGEYLVPRSLNLSGNFIFTGSTINTYGFNYSYQDTVKVKGVNELENSGYPFTQGKLPAEPFFSGILEPIVAVGTAALAVILFFTIRSK
jgi:hypothetical protein